MYAPETAGRTFFVNKEHGVVFAGGVIHGDDQVPLQTDDPFVGAAILMNHHTGQCGSLSMLAVDALFGTSRYAGFGTVRSEL